MAHDKQRKTFISYSRVNKDFALKMAKELKAEGFSVWLDQLDIPLGARWDVELEKALAECEIFMIIMTPASIASENVRDEIGYAIDNGKRFLPVLLENCNVPLRLRRFQYVDFTTKSFNDGVESAKELLRNLVEQTTIPPEATSANNDDQAAQAKDDRLAKQKAVDELTAKSKADAERKAKEEAALVTAQKIEADRLAEQKQDDELASKSKADAERKAKEEAAILASQKADSERKANEKPVDAKAELPSAIPAQKKPVSKGLVIGIVAVVVLIVAGIGFSTLSTRGTTATPAPTVENTVTVVSTQPVATEEIVIADTATDASVIPTNTKPPAATSTPTTPYVVITDILLDNNTYIVDYEVHNFSDTLHVHMFFDTIPPEQAGSPGSGPWKLTWGKYGDPPFTQYGTANRPAGATQMCALVANSNHSIQLNSGNCVDLP